MADLYWQIHPYTVVAFLAYGLLTALGNSIFIRRLKGRSSSHTELPFVSILVPARNEELNIAACVRSLLAQDYPSFEVIVLDDQSTDATRSILDEIKKQDPRLTVLSGQSLPPGWLGKHWACSQMTRVAVGELLLFTDADTWHEAHALYESAAVLLEERADLLTAFPHEQALTWGEKLTVPILGFTPFAFVPVFLTRWWPQTRLSLTIGQFMLFRRAAYDAAGGHEAVRSHPVDDVMLGRRVIDRGLKWILVNGTEHIHCRMYRSFGSAVTGFTRTLFAFFDYHILLYLLAWFWIGCIFLEPLIVILLAEQGIQPAYFPTSLAWIAVLEAVLLFFLIYWRFRFPIALVGLYPVSISLFVWLALRSLLFAWLGNRSWKDRHMPRPTFRF